MKKWLMTILAALALACVATCAACGETEDTPQTPQGPTWEDEVIENGDQGGIELPEIERE